MGTFVMKSTQNSSWDPGGSAVRSRVLVCGLEALPHGRSATEQRFGEKGQNEFPGVCGGSRGCFLTRGMAWTVLDHETASCLADLDTSLSTCLQSAQAAFWPLLAGQNEFPGVCGGFCGCFLTPDMSWPFLDHESASCLADLDTSLSTCLQSAQAAFWLLLAGQNEFPGVCGGSRGCFLTRGMAWTVLDHETASCLADLDTSLSTCLQSAQAAFWPLLAGQNEFPGVCGGSRGCFLTRGMAWTVLDHETASCLADLDTSLSTCLQSAQAAFWPLLAGQNEFPGVCGGSRGCFLTRGMAWTVLDHETASCLADLDTSLSTCLQSAQAAFWPLLAGQNEFPGVCGGFCGCFLTPDMSWPFLDHEPASCLADLDTSLSTCLQSAQAAFWPLLAGQNEFPGVCGGSRGCFLTRGMAWTVLDHETASCLADLDTSLSTCLQSAQAAFWPLLA